MMKYPAPQAPCGNSPDGDDGARPKSACDCLPCTIPPFCRNHYYTGKLLTERDFSAEQRYAIDKLRLHHLALHGWGVVCGLEVKPHPYCPDRRIVVTPGLAIDRCGREIVVSEAVELELPQPSPPPPEEEHCPPEPPLSDPDDAADMRYLPPGADPGLLARDHRQEKPGEGECADACPLPPPTCDPRLDLYVCLRYAETPSELSPAPFDECACGSGDLQPNRICETFVLELSTDRPRDYEPVGSGCGCDAPDDCCDLYSTVLAPCAQPTPTCCLPLAVLRDWEVGSKVESADIDNSFRPILPSIRLHDQLIRCILSKLPKKAPTRITDLSWTHGGEYSCRDFMKLFIGDGKTPKAFELTFEAPVLAEGLSTHSFQALVVRHREKGGEGGYLEVAPARVWLSDDRTRAYLRIDPDYAAHCLEGTNFDLFLKLRGDVILDERGCPIDGELLARRDSDGTYVAAPPTGDGTPGGLFESWIEVLA